MNNRYLKGGLGNIFTEFTPCEINISMITFPSDHRVNRVGNNLHVDWMRTELKPEGIPAVQFDSGNYVYYFTVRWV